jgi:hypothetical protein
MRQGPASPAEKVTVKGGGMAISRQDARRVLGYETA